MTPLFLEMLNGGAVTPDLLWLTLLAVYLIKESGRRGLRALDWFHLPPSMNLIVAVFIVDFGVQVRSFTIWYWRRIEGGVTQFSIVEFGLLAAGGAMIVVGTLCKIRAWTKPDYGDWPWLAASALSSFAIGILLLFR